MQTKQQIQLNKVGKQELNFISKLYMISLAFEVKHICFRGQLIQIWNLPSLKIQDPISRN